MKLRLRLWLLLVGAFLASSAAAGDGLNTGPPAQIPEIVRVEDGPIEGTDASLPNVRLFASVPYAAAPVGDLRWRPPQPVKDWTERHRRSDRLPPQCPQIPVSPRSLFAPGTDRQDEDCLYLNIWTAIEAPAAPRPVMVWLHGGGFMQGSTAPPMYDGAALAKRGVVFVSVNYRLGVLGFLAHPALSEESARRVSGNYGLLDQIAALRWIQRNIRQFGGDPDNVTVVGQSAGSMSLSLLTVSPLATGLFHKGIGQTGAVAGMLTSSSLAEAEEKGERFARSLGAYSAADLRSIDAARLVSTAGILPGTFEPINDGWAVPGTLPEIYRSRRHNDLPLLIGSNKNENPLDPKVTLKGYEAMVRTLYGEKANALLSLFPAANDGEARRASRQLMTQAMAQYPMHAWAKLQCEYGTAPIYLYRFTRAAPAPPGRYSEQDATVHLGAWHGAEIAYALDNLHTRNWPWQATDRRLSEVMATYWVNFARTGNPNGAAVGNARFPMWPEYRSAPSELMELGRNIYRVSDPSRATFEVLDEYYALKP